jgi:DNA repair protein RecO (recombination protein O)
MQKYTAVILASRDIGEFDRLYILYTKEIGLVKAIGRGVRKQTAKLAGHLEPGTLSEVYIARSRGMGQITSAITIENFENIRKNFGKLDEMLKILGFFARGFAEEEKDEKIFNLLADFLDSLNLKVPTLPQSSPRAGEEVLVVEAFWWKLFSALGHCPETIKCAECGGCLKEKSEKYFSAKKGGVICEKCSVGEKDVLKISSNQIKLLRVFLVNPFGKILKVKVGNGELEKLGKIREDFRKYNF